MLDDYSKDFAALKPDLVHTDGTKYVDFVRTLEPDFRVVAIDIATGYGALLIGLVASALLMNAGAWPPIVVFLGALWIGFWVANIQLFLHEAAHYNIAPTRKRNDLLANIFLGVMVGTSIADYRKVHFKHHGRLGTTEDSEHSYFFPMNLILLFKMLTGIRVVEIMLFRQKVTNTAETVELRNIRFIALGVGMHLAVMAALYALSGFGQMIAWCLGIGIFFPIFGAVRQTLEHRSEEADAQTNYFEVDHGALTRNFSTDIFSRTFGGAGFNRHLLHHWDPNISYTRFDEVMAFLKETEAAQILEQRQSSYAKVLWSFLKSNPTNNAA